MPDQGQYRSPTPTKKGVRSGKPYHIFRQANGSEIICEPACCREHYREAHWQEGQTHG